LAPQAGVRWYPARRVSVRADFRLVLWKLRYPLGYKQPSPVDGGRVLPLDASLDEWTSHPWITIGLGWTFEERDCGARSPSSSRASSHASAEPPRRWARPPGARPGRWRGKRGWRSAR